MSHYNNQTTYLLHLQFADWLSDDWPTQYSTIIEQKRYSSIVFTTFSCIWDLDTLVFDFDLSKGGCYFRIVKKWKNLFKRNWVCLLCLSLTSEVCCLYYKSFIQSNWRFLIVSQLLFFFVIYNFVILCSTLLTSSPWIISLDNLVIRGSIDK